MSDEPKPEPMLTPEKLAEMRAAVNSGKATPAELFSKMAENMIAQGLKESQDFETFAKMALADIMQRVVDTEATAVRIEAKLNLLSGDLLGRR